MPETIYERMVAVGLLVSILICGVYILYAVIRKKPLADPESPGNIFACQPLWPKSLHRPLLVIIGVMWSVFSLGLLIAYFIRWF